MKKKSRETQLLERRLNIFLIIFASASILLIVILFVLFRRLIVEDYCFNQLGKSHYGRTFPEQLKCEKETGFFILF